jgi:hypothetical protein
MIILNYIQIITEAESVIALRQSEPLKLLFHDCWQMMSPVDRERLLLQCIVPDVKSVPVFILKNFQPNKLLHSILADAAYLLHEKPLDEADDVSVESLKPTEEVVPDDGSIVTKDSKQLRREKENLRKAKHDEQRQKDAIRRSEVAKQRMFLYNLIQTDQISKVFEARAGSAQLLQAPSWETGPKLDELDEVNEGFAEIASGAASRKSEAPGSPKPSTKK